MLFQAAYDEDDKTRKSKESETDYHDTLFVESFDQKSLNISHETVTEEGDSSDEVESASSDVEEFSVKKSTNHKVFKGNNSTENSEPKKRLTRSADLKKVDVSPPKKLPTLTKVNIQNVPKGITITKAKKPVPVVEKKTEAEATVKKNTPTSSNSSPDKKDNKPSGTQKFAVIKSKPDTKDLSPKSAATADNPKRSEVQKVKLTKSQVAAMAKEGKIAVKDGQVFLRNGPNKNTK